MSRRTPTRLIASTLALAPSLLVLLTLLGMGTFASRAHAQYPDPNRRIIQISSRLYNGFGFGHGLPHQGMLGDTGIRSEILWGKPGDEHFRFGPQLDIRSACHFSILVTCIGNQTIEASAGPALLIPFRRGYPLVIAPTVGYAFRRDAYGGDGFLLSNTLSWGYRPYNYFHRYGYGIMAFASHRIHLNDIHQWEMTFGIEFDMELAVWTPILMVRMAFQNDDPDELEDPEAEDVGGASTGTSSDDDATPAPAPAPESTPAPTP